LTIIALPLHYRLQSLSVAVIFSFCQPEQLYNVSTFFISLFPTLSQPLTKCADQKSDATRVPLKRTPKAYFLESLWGFWALSITTCKMVTWKFYSKTVILTNL